MKLRRADYADDNVREPCNIWDSDEPIPWEKDEKACIVNSACDAACKADPKKRHYVTYKCLKYRECMVTQPGSSNSSTIWGKDVTKNADSGVADYRAVMKVRRRPLKSRSYVPCVTWAEMKKHQAKYYEKLANFAAMKGTDQNGDVMAAPDANAKTQPDVRQWREFEQLYVSFKDRPYYCGIKNGSTAKAKELVAGKVICRDALLANGNINDSVTNGAKRKLTTTGDKTNDQCAVLVEAEMKHDNYDGKVIANHYMVYKPASHKLCYAVYTPDNC